MSELNSREKLLAIADWLGWQDENLSEGLKCPEDAIKLYNFWIERSDSLPEFADDLQDDEGRLVSVFRKAAVGYDPLNHLEAQLEDIAIKKFEAQGKFQDWEEARDFIRKLILDDLEHKLMVEYNLVRR